ncbi:MAG: hypothetical protein ACRYG2_23670 [Janthinobacterium lividum]
MSDPTSLTGPDDRRPEPHGYPVPVGDPVPVGEPAPRTPAAGARLGRASGVELRQELRPGADSTSYSLTVLAFRLLEPGSPQPLDVQPRGRSLSGTVRDGDWVEVPGPPDATGRWDVARLENLTTGSTVVMTDSRRGAAATVVGIVALSVFALVFLLIVAAVVVGFASSSRTSATATSSGLSGGGPAWPACRGPP